MFPLPVDYWLLRVHLPFLMTVQRLRHQQRKAVRGLFAHYTSRLHRHSVTLLTLIAATPLEFLSKMKNSQFDDDVSVSRLCNKCPLLKPKPLFKNVFCVSPSSAPVKRMFSQRFSQSWLIMCANRARMSDFMLESLVFLSCNSHLWLPGICLKLSQCNFQCSRFVTVQDYRLLLF